MCGFQITHWVKQFPTCQRTNYHDTTNYSGYLQQLELPRSRYIRVTNLCAYVNIIKSSRQQGFPWLSFAIHLSRLLHYKSILVDIQCPQKAHEYKFLLVCPCVGVHKRTLLISSPLLFQKCLVCLTWMVRGRTANVLWGAASKICWKQYYCVVPNLTFSQCSVVLPLGRNHVLL